ncbi:CRP-like cAMP-binding protein [Arcicella aurantiaca]|uniref:CRP-like cAMP-binding protein n=1 Tax=Arcicella aurantiaca TaxID=591202 RepID=A0A316EB24_9BACT|nr:Crp/Fnr family transcriptional regulator [Arcicella aurantiaca]PWK28001.1 CRP-like cAMP-binding protein [Arcicella aurantiaca]
MQSQLKIFFRRLVDFSDKELEEVKDFFHPKKIKKGEFLCVPGETAHEIGFILKGAFRVYYLVEGKESTRFLGCENIFITSSPSFTSQIPSIEYVEALENAELLMLSFQDLQMMYKLSHKWERMVRLLAEYSYNEQQQRIYSLIALSAQERYESLVQNRPDLIQRVPQYIIANYLGISPETLSRIRKY